MLSDELNNKETKTNKNSLLFFFKKIKKEGILYVFFVVIQKICVK